MITIDPEFKALIPPLSHDELRQLEENIVSDGCRDPIVVWEGILLDGHNRHEICTRLGIEFRIHEINLPDRTAALDWMDANQLGRRNLSPEQMSLIRGRIYNRSKKSHGGDRKSKDQNDPLIEDKSTAETLASKFGVSAPTVKRDGKFAESVESLKAYAPDIGERVMAGEVRRKDVVEVTEALQEIPEDARHDLVAKGESEILAKAKEIRAERTKKLREERVKKISEISKGNAELNTEERFPVIYADPPWRYEHASSESRAIENQYPTMTLDDICQLEIPATEDAILFLWTTSPKLEEGMRVVRDWGFTYRTCAVWDKQKIGMGYYFRQQHEILLVATKGSIPAPEPAARPGSVFSFKRGEHSSKPEEVAEMIEKMYPEFPKLEMFCRSPRKGWSVWGNQSNE